MFDEDVSVIRVYYADWPELLDASLVRCLRGIPLGVAPEMTQDTVEGLCLSADLGTPRDSSGRARQYGRVREVWASLFTLLPP